MLATSVNLMPDYTLLPLLGIFLIVLAVLHFLVFRPILRLIDARKAATEGELAHAREMDGMSDTLDEMVRHQLEEARARGAEKRQELRQEAEASARDILDKARRETAEYNARNEEERKRMRDEMEAEMESRVSDISQMICITVQFCCCFLNHTLCFDQFNNGAFLEFIMLFLSDL